MFMISTDKEESMKRQKTALTVVLRAWIEDIHCKMQIEPSHVLSILEILDLASILSELFTIVSALLPEIDI